MSFRVSTPGDLVGTLSQHSVIALARTRERGPLPHSDLTHDDGLGSRECCSGHLLDKTVNDDGLTSASVVAAHCGFPERLRYL
jgi:hypothetical protein